MRHKLSINFWDRTISRDLILGLTFTLIVIVSFVGMLYYKYAVINAEYELKAYADTVTRQFSQDIALPLFNFEVKIVRHIAKAILQAESLVGLTVKVNEDVVFEQLPTTSTGIFSKEKAVVWQGETVGHVILQFTDNTIAKERRTLLTFMAYLLSCVILVIVIAIHFILKSFLNQPLEQLMLGLKRIAAGDCSAPLTPVGHSDINMIINEINRMADQIVNRTRDLVESEKKYRSIFENAVEGMFKMSAQGKFLDANPAMATILGYDSPKHLMRELTDIDQQLYVDPNIRENFNAQLETDAIVQGYELELFRRDGNRIWVESNARAVCNQDGKLVAIEGFMMDISRRKQMAHELRQAQDELEERVSQRTFDLEEKTAKLKRLNKLFIDRELRMKALKADIQALKIKIQDKSA